MHTKKISLLFALLFVALSISAQTHNVRRGSVSLTNKPSPSTSTKKNTSTTTNRKTSSSNSQKHSSQQNRRQASSFSQTLLNPVIQNLINNMVYIEGGTFTMGATSEPYNDAYENEKPINQVTVTSFFIGRYEVTQKEWEAVMGGNPSKFKGANRPVEQVSWDDCQIFIHKLNSITGKKFCLPSEAEWEFAARGGNKSHKYKYAGGNDIEYVAWYQNTSHNETHNIGTKSANELGLYDMSGNVCEWCCDRNGSGCVNRGGSWIQFEDRCRILSRNSLSPNFRYNYIGLRLVCHDKKL